MKPYKILVTNDDSLDAPGIRFLIEIMKELGEVTVMAPDKPQSGTGHAITFAEPLRYKKHAQTSGYVEYSCNGTPVDCIKLAENKIMDDLPDIVVSGINHGSNASINVIYSGTMAAVIEACIDGIPAIGFSLDSFSHAANLNPSRSYIKKIVQDVLEKGMPQDICLNVNIPAIENIKGIHVCRQAKASWQEGFETRTDPRGMDYHWLTGSFVVNDHGNDTDLFALQRGYISAVPIHIDLTAYQAMETLKYLED